MAGKQDRDARRRRVVVGGRVYSADELAWAQRRQVRGQTMLLSMLALAFVFGIVFYLLADAIRTGALVLPEGWRADLVGDFSYNLGLILWTSVVVALFLQVGVDYSQRRAEQYVEDVEQALETLGYDVPPDAGESADADELAALTAKLETLVAAVDRVQAELATLKAELHGPDE